MREKLFKLFFPKEYQILKDKKQKILDTLWQTPKINFAKTDENGKPKHYLEGLTDTQRKYYIASLSSLYSDNKFNEVVDYTINLIGNQTLHVVSEENMKNGRYAIVGIRTLMTELHKAHQELNNKEKEDEEFDPHEII